jgi:hypothetical protein
MEANELPKCQKCPQPTRPGKSCCQTCADKMKQQQIARKAKNVAAGICPICGKQPVESGRRGCRNCLDKYNEKTKTRRPANREKMNAAVRNWMAKKVESGVCPICNDRPVRPSLKSCGPCADKGNTQKKLGRSDHRAQVLAAYGACCVSCGEKTPEFLEVDHVNNDGAAHRKIVNPSDLLRHVVENAFPATFQLLCTNCNREKGPNRPGLKPESEYPVGSYPCGQCLKRPARNGHSTCYPCAVEKQRQDAIRYAKRKQMVFDYYGNSCACCGSTRSLQIDHVNNDGAAHRKEVGSNDIFRWLIQNGYPAGFRTLCANCNHAIKNYGSCPHQRKEAS